MKRNTKFWIYGVLCALYALAMVPILQITWHNNGAAVSSSMQTGPYASDVVVAAMYCALLALSALVITTQISPRNTRATVSLQLHAIASLVTCTAAVAAWLTLSYFGWRYVAWACMLSASTYGLHWLRVHHYPKGITAAFK